MSSLQGDLGRTLQRMDYGRALKEALLMGDKSQPWVPYAQPLLDAVSLFEDLGIGYALIGGTASMYYGRTRFTEDVDFVAVAGHGEKLAAAPGVMQKHHFDPGCTWKLYHQSGVQVDLWKDEHGDEIVQNAVAVELVGRTVQVAEVHDLVAMKLRAGRVKDDYDISEILRGGGVDLKRLEAMVSVEQWARLEGIRARG